MNRIVYLNPASYALQGSFLENDAVLVKCDAADNKFTITLPDAGQTRGATLKFCKIDSTNNIVTLSARTDLQQKLSNEDTQELLVQGDLIIYTSDGDNWW